MKKVESCNDIGLWITEPDCRMPDIHFYPEHGSVILDVTVLDFKSREVQAIQYLTPQEAMKFASAMKACAIQALEEAAQ